MTTQIGIHEIDKKQFVIPNLDFKKGPNKRPLVTMGIDLGYGWIKARSSEGIELLLPSVYGLPDDPAFKNADGEVNKEQNKVNHFKSLSNPHPETEYYVMGSGIVKAEKPMTTFDAHRYDFEPYIRVMQFTAGYLIGECINSPVVDVVVTLGVPSEDKDEETVEKLKKNFQKEHIIEKDGVQVKINILNVFVQTQPMGSHCNLIFTDKAGKSTNTSFGKKDFGDLSKQYYGLIDFGNRTVDLEGIMGGSPRTDDRDTLIGYGMKELYTYLAKQVNKKHRTSYTAKTIEPLIDSKFMFSHYGISMDCKTLADNYLEKKALTLLEEVNNVWENRQSMQHLFIVGGGSDLFASRLKNLDPKFTLVPNAQMSNAHGFHKFSQIMALKLYGKKK